MTELPSGNVTSLMKLAASHLDTGTVTCGMGVFVAGRVPVNVAVGRGRPGVAVKPDCVPTASSVRAEAVYSPFNVANGSGVDEFDGILQASWASNKITTERMMVDFLDDMVPPFEYSND